MKSILVWMRCAVALLALSPAHAAPLDASRLATHLEAELRTAHQAIERHGARMEAALAPSTRGQELATEARALRSALPGFIRDNPHLFEELLGDLELLERQREPMALQKSGQTLTLRLRGGLGQGLIRIGNRVGAPPALVVSGGVSLGSYQAGFLYYYTLFLHDRAEVLRAVGPEHRASLRKSGLELPEAPPSGFTIVTGASAGSVNALLSAYAGCRAPERTPGKSLFFQTWNTLALETLLQPGSVGNDHTFSSKPIMEAIHRLETLDPSGWRRCRFSLGATTTRLQSREIALSQAGGLRSRPGEQLRLARFTEKFLLTAQGDAQRAPEFCPFPGCEGEPPPGPTFYPRLAQPEGGPIPLQNVFNMVAASGAFPTAFEPRVIAHRYFDTQTGTWVDDATSRFADGGIYNNNPLDLALRMSQWETAELRGSHRFLYFDPNAVGWKWAPEQQRPWDGPGLLSTYEELLTGFAGTAMSAQLMDTLEAEPEIRERIDVPVRHAPLAGEYLLAMSAFLDEDFRTFDFHRGMVDAWHFVSKESDNRILFEALAQANPEAPPMTVDVDSPLFECFLAFERSEADEPGALPACGRLQTEESRNILSLMAVSRKLRRDPKLSQGNKFERFTEALATRGYVFRSGLLKGQTASALQGRFRQVFGDAVTGLTHQQPGSQRLGFQVGTKLALDSAIAYQPVPFYSLVGITSGGLELAVSPSLLHWKEKELRLRTGVRASYGESARFSGGVSPPDLDTAAYVSGVFGFGPPPIRLEAGLGLLTEASYLPDTGNWVAVRFAVEGALMLVAAEHLEISLRPRLYLDRGRASSPLYVPTTDGADAPRRFEAVGLLLGAGWRF